MHVDLPGRRLADDGLLELGIERRFLAECERGADLDARCACSQCRLDPIGIGIATASQNGSPVAAILSVSTVSRGP